MIILSLQLSNLKNNEKKEIQIILINVEKDGTKKNILKFSAQMIDFLFLRPLQQSLILSFELLWY